VDLICQFADRWRALFVAIRGFLNLRILFPQLRERKDEVE
jgi:hypothetical protein